MLLTQQSKAQSDSTGFERPKAKNTAVQARVQEEAQAQGQVWMPVQRQALGQVRVKVAKAVSWTWLAALVIALLEVCLLGLFACAPASQGDSNGEVGAQVNSGTVEQNAAEKNTSEQNAGDLIPTGAISVISREDGSGTRGAFVELLGIEQDDGSGEKVDMTTPSSVITNSTSVMMTAVAGDENAIGYISLGSLNDTVKALEVDGVEATAANVKTGRYAVARPFNVVVGDSLNDAARNFLDFIMSDQGQAIVEENGYIAIDENAPVYETSGDSGRVVIAGSSSVTPVMEKLAEAYEKLNPEVKIEINQSDSTTGITGAIEGTCDIGMASRELKESETSRGVKAEVIAQDGIAVIVNDASTIDGLTTEQIRAIYTGEISEWSQVSSVTS